MSVTYTSSAGMTEGTPYHHVSIGYGSRHIHVAGQVARGVGGEALSTELRGQVADALRNVAKGLAAADAGFADVLRLSFYVTRWQPEKIADVMAGVEDVADEIGLTLPMAPASLIGVDYLFEPDVQVEIEATAITD